MDNKEYGVKLSVDISDLEKKLDRAKQLTTKAKQNIEAPLQNIKVRKAMFKYQSQEANVELARKEVEEQQKRVESLSNSWFEATQMLEETNKKLEYGKKQLEEWNKYKEAISGVIKLSDESSRRDFNARDEAKQYEIGVNRMEFYRKAVEQNETALWGQYKQEEAELEKLTANYNKQQNALEIYGLEVEDAKNKVEAMSNKSKEASNNVGNLGKNFEKLSKNIKDTVEKNTRQIERFTLSLFGVRSAYSILSRAVRSYMAYDEKANQRIQANWIALGAMFAPIVENIVKWIQRLTAYINVFYKALTGKDFISIALDKVKAKANGTSKAVKSLNKELANFDEITNLDFDKGNENDLGIAEALSELKDIDLNPEIVNKVENLAKEFKEHILPALEELWGFVENTLIPAIGRVYNKFDEWGIPLEGVLFTIGLISGGIKGGLMTSIGLFILKLWEAYDVWKEFNKSEDRLYEQRISILETHKTKLKGIQRELDTLSEKENLSKEELDRQNELIKEKEWRIQECQDQYEEFNEDIKNGKVYSREQAQEIQNIGKEIDEITKGDYNIDFNIDAELTKQAKNTLNELERVLTLTAVLTPLMTLPLAMITAPFIDSWLNKNKSRGNQIGALKNLKGFAKGNVAYGPTVAEFGEYAGARTNPEITTPQSIMKQTMVEALQEAMPEGSRSGDAVLVINGKELARATYGDFQAEGNRLGTSNVAIRRV